MTDQPQHPFSVYRQFRPEEKAPGLGETFGAAFRLENDMLNVAQLATKDRFDVDPTFDLMEHGPKSRHWLDHGNALARAQSLPELQALELRLDQELADRALLASQGWTGLLAGMAAGVVSPLIFLPLVGPSRGAKGVAEAFGLAAIAASAQEAPLLYNQMTRTGTEAAVAIAGGTVLGGLIGSGAVYLRSRDFDRIARDLAPDADNSPRALVYQTKSGTFVREGEQTPLQGLDAPVVPKDPPLAPGWVRVYHSGSIGEGSTGRWVSTNRQYASDYRQDLPLYYLDIRADDPRITPDYLEQSVDKGFTFNFELTPQEAIRLRSIARINKETPGAIKTPVEAGGESAASPTGGSIGAKATADAFNPQIRVVGPDGKETWESLVPDGEPLQTGAMKDAGWIGRAAAWMSPPLRSINQTDMPIMSPVARRNMSQLSDAGVQLKGNQYGLTSAAEGTVESRLNFYDALVYRALKKLEDGYLDYVLNGKAVNAAERMVWRARMELGNAPPGKLNYEDFKAEVARAMNIGDKSDIPQVADIARVWRQDFFGKINEAAKEAADLHGAKRLYKEIKTDIDKSYFSRVHSPEYVNQFRDEYIKLVADHYEATMTGTFRRRWEKLKEREAADLEYEQIMRLGREEAEKMRANTLEALKGLRNPAELDPRVDEIAGLRQQARDLVDEAFEKLEEAKNPNGIPKMSKFHRQKAKESTKVEAEMLRDRANELEEALPAEVGELKRERKALKRRLSAVNESFGRFEARQADAYSKIERNEELNIAAFQRVVRETQRFLRDMEKMDEKRLAAELARLEKSWEAATKAARRGEERIVDLENRHLFSGLGRDQLDEEALKQAKREARESRAFDRLSGALLRDRDALVQQIQDRLDGAISYVNTVNTRRAERNVALREKAGKYNPEEITTRLEARAAARTNAERELEEAARELGGLALDDGVFNFAAQAEELATMLANKVTGMAPRIAGIDAMKDLAVGLRSPMKMRGLDIPYDQLAKFLERDVEKVVARYARTVGADIELFRAFGDRSGGKALVQLTEDLDRIDNLIRTREVDEKGKKITDKRRQKEVAQFLKARRRRMDELSGTIDRIRLLWGLPSDPNSLAYRIGRTFMNMNVTTMMGTAAVTSAPDAARSVMAHGLHRTFGDSWMPFVRAMVDESAKPLKAHLIREARLAGIGIDVFSQNRARGTFGLFGYEINQTKFERFWEYAAHKTPTVALFGPWTDINKTLTAATTMSRMMRSIQDIAEGRARPDDINYLAQAGLSPAMIRRIYAQIADGPGGTRYKDVILPNTESWTDYQALRAFQAALSREDARMVITPGLERPLWMDASMLGRIVAQFRSFTMAANTKMLVAGLQTRNMAALHTLQGTIFSLALGAVSYYIWAMTAGERAREEMRNASWETWLDQALYRSGLLGAFSEAQSIGSQIPLTQGVTTFADSAIAGRRADNIMGAVAGPTFGKAWDIAGLLAQIDSPTEGTIKQARKLLPYQNVFWLREGLNQVEAAVASNFPERRQ